MPIQAKRKRHRLLHSALRRCGDDADEGEDNPRRRAATAALVITSTAGVISAGNRGSSASCIAVRSSTTSWQPRHGAADR